MRIQQVSSPSPFDYANNALLYISENLPFPDQDNDGYIKALADEIERLVMASYGHAALLFTSYRVMDTVWDLLSARSIPYPMFKLEQGSSAAIDSFKQSKNGILFASGSMYEGVDIPGDILSLLIIVKLPFSVPSPIDDYEKSQYPSFIEYRDRVLIPEMLIKLRQAVGRALRNERDTAIIALLDSRAGICGRYREQVLEALPEMKVTGRISDFKPFLMQRKPKQYFLGGSR